MANSSTCQKHVNRAKTSAVIFGVFSDFILGLLCAECKKSSVVSNSSVYTESQMTMNVGSLKAMFVHLTTFIAFYPAVYLSTSQGVWFNSLWLLLYLLPALIIRFSSKSTEFERGHTNTYLNLQLSLFIYVVVLIGMYFAIYNYLGLGDQVTPYPSINSPIGQLNIYSVLLAFILVCVASALNVQAAVAAYKGKEYRYPIAIRFLK
jgi:uncharacterized Tic20 family protein